MSNKIIHADIGTCKQRILESVNQYNQFTFVLDVLDECDEIKRVELFDLIDSLVVQTECPVRVFVSARPESDFEDRLSERLTCNTGGLDVDGDVRNFINHKVARLPFWEGISEKVQEYAIEILKIGKLLLANGTSVDHIGGLYGGALTYAAIRDDFEMVGFPLDHDASVNLPGGIHGGALISVACHGWLKMARFLTSKSADVNQLAGPKEVRSQ